MIDYVLVQATLRRECPEVVDTNCFEANALQMLILEYLGLFALSSSSYKHPALWPLVKIIPQGLDVGILQYRVLS